MNSTIASQPPVATRWLARLVWALLAALGAYYLVTAVGRYLTFDEAKIGPYFWPRANMVFVHAISGSIALIMGFFQFWPWLRNTHKKIHRAGGRVYLVATLVGAISGYALAFTSSIHVVYAGGLAGLATAWLLTGGMAFISIRNRNINQHKQWMVRSYVVTFAFISFRVASDIFEANGVMEFPLNVMFLSWACWAIPLLFTEVVLQWKQATRKQGQRS